MKKNENSYPQITYSVIIMVSLISYLNIIKGEKRELTFLSNLLSDQNGFLKKLFERKTRTPP